MTGNALGIDVSSYQPPLTAAQLEPLDFAWCKATEGLSITDSNLAANWATLAAWGKPRGAYHEFYPADGPAAQAEYCYQQVAAAGGFRPGDMAAVVASDYPGTTGAMIAAWCTEMTALAGPQVAILVYSDLSVLPSLGECTSWPLWVAWPNPTPPTTAQLAPWTTWTFWQNGITTTDTDQFNGTPAQLTAWLHGASTQEDDMLIIAGFPNGEIYLLSGGKLHYITSPSDVMAYQGAGIQTVTVSAGEATQLLEDYPPGNPAVTVTTPPLTLPDLTITGTITPQEAS
jgi:lysozyme